MRQFSICRRPPPCYGTGVFTMRGSIMIDRRAVIRFTLAALPAAWLAVSPARAQDFQKYVPFLVELPGWTGNKADGMAMQMSGASMISATREYKKGNSKLNAQIVSGTAAQGMLGAVNSGVKLETAEMHINTTTVDGLTVMRTFQVKDKSGTILVALGPSALFNLAFNGVPEDEALGLAKRFDWKAIQAALPK
jgi:hypothetical protein